MTDTSEGSPASNVPGPKTAAFRAAMTAGEYGPLAFSPVELVHPDEYMPVIPRETLERVGRLLALCREEEALRALRHDGTVAGTDV